MSSDLAELTAAQQPTRLLKLMVVVAMVSISVILIVAGGGIYQVFERQLVEIAEKDAVQVASELIRRQADGLLRKGPQGQVELAVDLEQLDALEHQLQHLLEPFNIVKVNIFSPEWLVLYSSDHSQIGRNDFGNARLASALQGEPDSHLVRQEEIVRPGNRQAAKVDVVESYIPIRTASGRVVGCLEVYRDITEYRQELVSGVVASVLLLLLVLLGVFGLSYLYLRKAAGRLQAAEEALLSKTVHDQLTGVANRKEIARRAGVELSRLQRLEETGFENCLVLMVVDLDHLDLINQEYGRQVGDRVLCVVAERLTRELRGYDAVGRYGGDEFLVMLPACTRPGGQSAAERIRALISELPVSIPPLEIEVTATIGLAVAQVRDASYEQALARALGALSEGKSRGGNCVVCDQSIDIPQHPARVGTV